MKIVYRPHLIRRLKKRKVPKSYLKKILKTADNEYFDNLTKHRIAIKKLFYAGRLRNMVVAYDIIEENIAIITIHPIKTTEIQNKILSGRWKDIHEKN